MIFQCRHHFELSAYLPNVVSELLEGDTADLSAYKDRDVYVWREGFEDPHEGYDELMSSLEEVDANVLSAEEFLCFIARPHAG